MHSSRRAQRMKRHHKRNQSGTLSLVSLMDIFTILVFFLLVNSSAETQLPSAKIKLPESTAEQIPEDSLVVVVTDSEILIQGQRVVSIAEINKSGLETIPALKQELDSQDQKSVLFRSATEAKALTIMGDKEIPYKILRKIIATLGETRFTNIALAVQKKPEKSES